MTRETWLNGWHRQWDGEMLLGTSVHCVGCGKFMGITTVAFPENWRAPGPEPTWPFDAERCPVCALREKAGYGPVDKLTERLKALHGKSTVGAHAFDAATGEHSIDLDGAALTSPDGITWTRRPTPR